MKLAGRRIYPLNTKYDGSESEDQAKEEHMELAGTWHIFEMEMWGKAYFNMEVQAYMEINPDGSGKFQFGLVSGYMDGEIVNDEKIERLDFTWEGNDESDPAFGSGWVRMKEKDLVEGRIKLHTGDASTFSARRFK